jgi:predicted DNA-binding protein
MGVSMRTPENSNKATVGKTKISISIDRNVQKRLANIGEQYGLKLSNMIERAVRYYLEEMEDVELALERLNNPEGRAIPHDEFRKTLMGS